MSHLPVPLQIAWYVYFGLLGLLAVIVLPHWVKNLSHRHPLGCLCRYCS